MSNTQGGWWADGQFGQLPPEYAPVHHEPRRRPAPRPGAGSERVAGSEGGGLPPGHTRPWGPSGRPQPQAQPQRQGPPQWQEPQWQEPQWQEPQWQEPQRQAQQRPFPQPPARQPGHPGQPGHPARYDEDPRAYSGQYGDDGLEAPGFMPGFAEGQEEEEDWVEPDTPRQQSRMREHKPAKRRRARWLAPWIAVLVILTPLAVGGYFANSYYQNKYHPADFSGAGSGSVQFLVKSGDTATSVGPELVNLGVIASSRALVLAAENSSSTAGMEPGTYILHKHMQASLAYAILSNPKNIFVAAKVTLPEGLRKTAVIARLAAIDSQIPLSAYQQALTNPSLGLPSYAKGNAEGYLFPSQYQIPPHSTALSVLQQMVQRFNAEATTANLVQGAQSLRLSPEQVIVVASLLQAEGGRLSDYPKIARVIYNRMAVGMPLQFDSTVFYGLGTYGTRATAADLLSNSPYNTYKFKGLPPGPIDSPGDAAIQAALHPAAGNWLYFVTVNLKTGETKFTNSFTQFEQFQQELDRNMGQG